MPAVSLIMLTRPRRSTGASARRSTRVTPRAALAIGADTTDSVSIPGTSTSSIGRVKRLLEHFRETFFAITRAGDPQSASPIRTSAAFHSGKTVGLLLVRRDVASAVAGTAPGHDRDGGGQSHRGRQRGGVVPLDVRRVQDGETVQRPDDQRRLSDDVVDGDGPGVLVADVA